MASKIITRATSDATIVRSIGRAVGTAVGTSLRNARVPVNIHEHECNYIRIVKSGLSVTVNVPKNMTVQIIEENPTFDNDDVDTYEFKMAVAHAEGRHM